MWGRDRRHVAAAHARPLSSARSLTTALVFAMASAAAAQTPAPPPAPSTPPAAQSPSPMRELTRSHERLTQAEPAGVRRRFIGPAGRTVEMLVPPVGSASDTVDIVIHFHGAAWIALQAAAAGDQVGVALNLGGGSSSYGRPFAEPEAFDTLLAQLTTELRAATGRRLTPGRLTLVGFSAGYGAIRALLRVPSLAARIDAVLLLDGLHTSYLPEGRLLADGGLLDTAALAPFAEFARRAMRGEARFVITHSEIFPGTFASTTECTDWLLSALALRRTAVLLWGPRGMQQLSEVRAGGFEILGFAGNSAPDHVDHLHALPELLRRTRTR